MNLWLRRTGVLNFFATEELQHKSRSLIPSDLPCVCRTSVIGQNLITLGKARQGSSSFSSPSRLLYNINHIDLHFHAASPVHLEQLHQTTQHASPVSRFLCTTKAPSRRPGPPFGAATTPGPPGIYHGPPPSATARSSTTATCCASAAEPRARSFRTDGQHSCVGSTIVSSSIL